MVKGNTVAIVLLRILLTTIVIFIISLIATLIIKNKYKKYKQLLGYKFALAILSISSIIILLFIIIKIIDTVYIEL